MTKGHDSYYALCISYNDEYISQVCSQLFSYGNPQQNICETQHSYPIIPGPRKIWHYGIPVNTIKPQLLLPLVHYIPRFFFFVATIRSLFHEFILSCSVTEIHKRCVLLKSIDSHMIYPLAMWPKDMQSLFWKKPPSDKGTFKLCLFLLGNSCPPCVTLHWIVSWRHWDKTKWIVNNVSQKECYWFYFDLYYNKYLCFNGSKRQK